MQYPIVFLFLLMACTELQGQCNIVTDCADIEDQHTISVITQSSGLLATTHTSCFSSADVISDVSLPNFVGDAIVFYVGMEIADSTAYIFISADSEIYRRDRIINVYSFEGGCDESVLVNSTIDDRSPEVVGMKVTDGMDYFIEVIVPHDTDIDVDSMIVRVSGVSRLEFCEPSNLDGSNDNYKFTVVYRSLGDAEPFYYPNEYVEILIEYNYTLNLVNNPQWLHTVVPTFGAGWIREGVTSGTVSIESTLGNEPLWIEPDEQCGTVVSRDLPYYCLYHDEAGVLKMCNLLTESCPCSDHTIEAGDVLPESWAFSRNPSNCDSTCSQSSKWGIGFTKVNAAIRYQLRVANDTDASRDLRVGIQNFSDAITGCFDPNYDICIPSITNWGPRWEVVDRNLPYGFLSSDKDRVCKGDSVKIMVDLENLSPSTILVHATNILGLSTGIENVGVITDTTFIIEVQNPTDTIIPVLFQLLRIDGQDSLLLDSVTVEFLPQLSIEAINTETCFGDCAEVTIANNQETNLELNWNDGSTDSSNIICPFDEVTISAYGSECMDRDTIIATLSLFDEINATFILPRKLCQNNIQDSEAYIIIVDTVIGGSPPYVLNWTVPGDLLLRDTFVEGKYAGVFMEESIVADLFVSLTILDNVGCQKTKRIIVPVLKDTLVEIDFVCQDGIFNINDPDFVLHLPRQDRPIESVDWLRLSGIEGVVLNDTTFILNEEESVAEGITTFVQALVHFTDGCVIRVNYRFEFFNGDRDFDFRVDDFEVDFTPITTAGIETITWIFGDGSSSTDFFPTHIYAEIGEYEVVMTIIDACNEHTKAQTVIITGTPVEEVVSSHIKVFPVPASDELAIISTLEQGFDIILYDVEGRIVKRAQSITARLELNVQDLPEGVYLLRIQEDTEVTVHNVVILR